MKLIKNNVFSFKMKNWEEEISGIFLGEGKEWVLIYDNSNDFILDGFRFISKKNISKIDRGMNEIFKERVFKLKNVINNFDERIYDLDNTILLFESLKKDKQTIQYDVDDEDEIFVGRVLEIDKDNFKIESITTRGELSSSYRCKYDEIRSLSIDNDYLNSLSLLIKDNLQIS